MSDHSLKETPKEIQNIYEGIIKGGARLFTKLREDQKKRLEVSTESIEDIPENDIPNVSISRDNTTDLDASNISVSRVDSPDFTGLETDTQPAAEDGDSTISADYDDEVPVFRQSTRSVESPETGEPSIPLISPEEPTVLEPVPSTTKPEVEAVVAPIVPEEIAPEMKSSVVEPTNVVLEPTKVAPEAEDRSTAPVVYPGFMGANKIELPEEPTSVIEPIEVPDFPSMVKSNDVEMKPTNDLYNTPLVEVMRGDENDDISLVNQPEHIPEAQVIRTNNRTSVTDDLTEEKDTPGNIIEESEHSPPDKKSTSENDFTNLSNELLFKNSGQDPIDKLTKEDAKALSLMLNGEIGENIPNAANLKIMVDGKVVAQADAQGRLITREQTSPALSKYFASLANEGNRPSIRDGSEQVAKVSEDSQAPGHQFMQGLINNMKVQESAYMPSVTQKEGLIETDMSSVDSVLNLYATKSDNEEGYQLKNGGMITSRIGNDETTQGYQFFTVEDAEGNIDMGFTVCPDGQILIDPKITNTLQNEIAAMQEAWDKGEISEDTPLMTKDKARAEAVQGFTRNIQSTLTSEAKNDSNPIEVTTNKKNQIVATNKKNPNAKMVVAKGIGGKMRVLSNSLSNDDILEFNKVFEVQNKLKEGAKQESSTEGNDKPGKPLNTKKKVAQKNTRSKRQGQSM